METTQPNKPIARTPVSSSNLVSMGHDPDTKVLAVEFPGGAVWHYADVSVEEYSTILNAPSIGSHFHKAIKLRKKGAKQSG